mmetsp:Transcript_16392/g.49135  ORF Transcript_16392/g.49135 Transcript_16392/m.49135 type:complete len:92 (-) Transcript_16392:3124-3399(-)
MDPALFTVTKLFRDCLRLSNYLASQSGIPNHRAALYKEIRQSFRQHINEKDPKKVEELKQAAHRGLSNYMFYEAQKMAKANQAAGNTNINS